MRILIAVNCGPLSEEVVRYGGYLASISGGKVALLTILEPYAKGQIRYDCTNELRRLAKHLPEKLEACYFTRIGDSIKEIDQMATEWQADYIVIGSHDKITSKFLFKRSFAKKMARTSKIPIVIAPRNTNNSSIFPLFKSNILGSDLNVEFKI